MRIRKNEYGFGILHALVMAAIMAGIALVLTQMISYSKRRSTLRQQSSKYQGFMIQLQKLLNDPVVCSNALGGKALNIGALNAWAPVRLNLGYGTDPGPIQGGWHAKKEGYKLERVEISVRERARYIRSDGTRQPRSVVYDWPSIGPTPNQFLKYKASIRILPDDTHWDIDSRDYVDLMVITTAEGVVHQCFGETSLAEACEKTGGAYDISNNSPAELRCNPDLYCRNHTVGLVSDPNLCTSPYKARVIGYFDGGLKYMCTWCNRNRPGVAF